MSTEQKQTQGGGEGDGPSKNELKKLAKKEAKAAKKAANKAGAGGGGDAKGGGAGADQGGKAAATPAPAAAPVVVVPPKLLLFGGSADCPATLKAVLAAQKYEVELGVAKKKDLPAGFNASNKPALIYGQDYVLGGGGNAMCKAIALIAGGQRENSFVADEWCEWERTCMRGHGASPKAIAASATKSLEKLSQALQSSASGGVHLVGGSDSMADICVLVTLSSVAQFQSTMDQWPKPVKTYYNAHAAALESAKTAVSDYLPEPPVDVDNDPNMIKVVTAVFTGAIEKAFPMADVPPKMVSKCSNPKHGDYQCTAAMPLFGVMKKNGTLPADIKSPQQIAQAIIAQLKDNPIVVELGVQGPGFVLCRLASSFLQKHMQKLVTSGELPKPKVPLHQCVVDFSSPNIAKDMHVGHLRSTIIGEAVCRILEFVGHTVERVNHVGDWGTQFGMLIQYLKEEYPNFSQDRPNITDLTAFYKNAKKRFDEDPEFKKTSQLNVVQLQGGDEEYLKVWNILCDISRTEFQKVYDRLDINVKECGESFYNSKIPPVIEEFEQKGLCSVEEGGAKCVFVGDEFPIPLMIQKSDGGYGYDSTDMAALKYRLHTLNAQRIIVITDFSQADHFKMCNKAARMIGWVDKNQKLEHIGFGTVQGEDGKRFKTRSGDTVRLVDLLDEAVRRMEASLRERIEEKKANITSDEVHEVAEAIGYGAVKYFDLRRNPTTNYKFSYDGMLDTKGNTAVYLLYARVRLESICAKAKAEHNVDVQDLLKDGTQISIDHASERNLALQLHQFADVIEQTLDDLFPYHICEYVYSVAIAASDFVTQCRVLGSPEIKSRLLLCHITTMAMHQCFDLLGIRHVKRI